MERVGLISFRMWGDEPCQPRGKIALFVFFHLCRGTDALCVWVGRLGLRLADAQGGEAGGALLTGALPTELPPRTHLHVPDDAAGAEQEEPPDPQPAPEATGLTLKREPGLEATLLSRRILDLGTADRPGPCDVVGVCHAPL